MKLSAFFAVSIALLSACGAATSPPASMGARLQDIRQSKAALPQNILISEHGLNTGLDYWPIDANGGHHPVRFGGNSGVDGAAGMAANGNVLVIANQYPAKVVLYDTVKNAATNLPAPFGYPADVAVGKDGRIALFSVHKNGGDSVSVYPAGSSTPAKLPCGLIDFGSGIAVDDENDVFWNGILMDGSTNVVEYPALPGGGYGACVKLPLPNENGYSAGIAIDPKTDDLLVLSNPGQCAGNPEGELQVYGKPYGHGSRRTKVLGGNCTGALRFNAGSTLLFLGDQNFSGSFQYVRQYAYPALLQQGGYFGGVPTGFTTIPNTLPN